MRFTRVLLCGGVALGTLTSAAAAQGATCPPARTALVLGGGGSKGLAHLGVLESLDSLGVIPDLIVGSSAGAIIGALYAAGESPASIRDRIRAAHLDAVVHTYDPYLSPSLVGLPALAVWERSSTRWVIQSGAVREGEANAILSGLTLRANLLAGGSFDRLPIPFRAVATDLLTREVVVLDRGDLTEALRASMGVPVLLRPMRREGRVLIDGGIGSNTPVRVARALGAERVIVSAVASPTPDLREIDDPLAVTNALFEFLFVQDSLTPREGDVVIRHPTEGYGMLDFRPSTLDSLIHLGRRTARSSLAAARCLAPAGRAVAEVPPLQGVGAVRVTASVPRDDDYVRRQLAITPHAGLDTMGLRIGIDRLGRSDRIRALWLNPTWRADSVDLDLRVESAPRQRMGIGVAFDHTMSGRLWMGGVHRELFGTSLEGTAVVSLGTYRRELTAAIRDGLHLGRRSLPVGLAVDAVSEQVRTYAGSVEGPPLQTEGYALFLGVRPMFEVGWTQEIGLDWRRWRQPSQPPTTSLGLRYAMRQRLAGVPTPRVTLEMIALEDWRRTRLEVTRRDTLGVWVVEPRFRLGAGRDLPILEQFVLGGLDGFAGLPLLALRGDHEAFASLVVRLPLHHRMMARVEPMVGIMGRGDWRGGHGEVAERSLLGHTLTGIRAGIEVETPLGPIRIEEGVRRHGGRQALIRVGHWF